MSEFKLTTTSFENEGMIPKRYTPHGEDYNPQLSWFNKYFFNFIKNF